MKKLVTLFAFALVAFAANAQSTVKGDMNDDGALTISDVTMMIDIILGNSPKSYLTCPDNNHPHMIDLGLPSGTKWACCNVDSDHPEYQSPTNYGGYYAWGETETKTIYTWTTYIHCEDSRASCQNLGSDIAGTQYDVAHVKWGDSWVMPSKEQSDELVNNCTYIWTTINGVKGGLFTGTNGGKIFLPANGHYDQNKTHGTGTNGSYWLSTQGPSYLYNACSLHLSDIINQGSGFRFYGDGVRPISK